MNVGSSDDDDYDVEDQTRRQNGVRRFLNRVSILRLATLPGIYTTHWVEFQNKLGPLIQSIKLTRGWHTNNWGEPERAPYRSVVDVG